MTISTDRTRAMISFNSHTQPKKWALLNNPTSLVRKPEVREVGWVAWGHVAETVFGPFAKCSFYSRMPGRAWNTLEKENEGQRNCPGVRGAILE